MAATVTPGTVSLTPTDVFRHYDGPPKPKRGQKRDRTPRRKVDPSPNVPFIDIEDILGSDFAGLGPVSEFGGDAVEGSSRDNPVTIKESESDTDSEDELPDLQELFFRRPFSNKEADAIPAAERWTTYESIWAAVGHEDGTASGEREEKEDVGGVMEPRTGDAVDAILTLTTMGTAESGDSPRSV